jgi:hypothetical protein
MAQLPLLIYDQKPSMTSSAFKELAENLLSEKDAALMQHLALDPEPVGTEISDSVFIETAPPTHCSFIDKWREWERTLRLNLAKNRAHQLKQDNLINFELPVVPTEAANTAAKAVFSELSPLDAEILIDKARWTAICELVGHDYFHCNNAYAYYLKLLLMERRASFNTEKGFAEYKSLYASILGNAQSEGESL